MNITLRAGERLYINGAVIRVDRKVTVELLNEVTFLLEHHVMQANEATTTLRQIYFVIQIMLMDPAAAAGTRLLLARLMDAAMTTYETPEIVSGLRNVAELIARSRNFEALKALRALYPLEKNEMRSIVAITEPHAA
jgi:flagellar protein FlbT